MGAIIKAYDPVAMKESEKLYSNQLKRSKNLTKISIIIPVFTGHENLK
ncbi:uncharacterized protein METZ01_LOCUS480505, partial [marine metagenome]